MIGIFGFITKFLYGIVIMKLIEFLPKLKGLLGVLKGAGKVFNFLISGAGFILDALIGFVDFGYKLVDGAEQLVGKIFGEEGAEKFRTFMENIKNLINAFIIWKVVGEKIFKSVIKNIKNAFKLVKNFIKRGLNLASKLFPNIAKGATKLFQAGKGLVSKGLAKVGGFAAKIFGKAAGVISPAFKGAKPFLSKFFGKIPIVGPLVITIVSLLSGEPATQAIFKGLGAALGGALGTFIPIPILGTLIGETIGVFVGDLLYYTIIKKQPEKAMELLKGTLSNILKGGKTVLKWIGGGFSRFFKNFMEEHSFELPWWVSNPIKKLTGLEIGKLPNILQLYNPMVVGPLLLKSFFPPSEEGSGSASTAGSGSGESSATGLERQEKELISANQKKGYEGVMEKLESYAPYEEVGGGSQVKVSVPRSGSNQLSGGQQGPPQVITVGGGGSGEDPYEVLEAFG